MQQVRNNLNQIYWRIIANNAILETPDKGQNSWIKKSIYDTSIKKVIGKAIGDCVTCENEFQGKEYGGVVTFEKTTPWTYEQKHWNAVVLYNLVEYEKRSVRYKSCKQNNTMYAIPEGFEKYEKVTFEQIEQDLIAHYTTLYQNAGHANKISELKDSIGLAISNIKEYDSALKLVSTLTNVMNTAYQYDYLDTRLWRIKTLRDLEDRVKKWVDYGNKIFSTAEKYVQKLQKFAEDSWDKIAELPEEKQDKEGISIWKSRRAECLGYSDRLKNLRKSYVRASQKWLNEQKVLVQTDEDLYKHDLIDDKLITDMTNTLSNIIRDLKSLYEEADPFSRIKSSYETARYYSKSRSCVAFTLKPLELESIPQPDNDLMQARTLHLAPELKQTREEGLSRDWYLLLNQKIKSPFFANPKYIQESNLVFINPMFQKTPVLDYIKTTIPVRKATESDKLNNKQLIEYDTDRNGPKYGVLDNREKLEVAYCSRYYYQGIKFKAEDPILGNIVAMIEDLIDELQWKKEERQRMEGSNFIGINDNLSNERITSSKDFEG